MAWLGTAWPGGVRQGKARNAALIVVCDGSRPGAAPVGARRGLALLGEVRRGLAGQGYGGRHVKRACGLATHLPHQSWQCQAQRGTAMRCLARHGEARLPPAGRKQTAGGHTVAQQARLGGARRGPARHGGARQGPSGTRRQPATEGSKVREEPKADEQPWYANLTERQQAALGRIYERCIEIALKAREEEARQRGAAQAPDGGNN